MTFKPILSSDVYYRDEESGCVLDIIYAVPTGHWEREIRLLR